MKHFCIIVNSAKDKNLVVSNKMKSYIENKGGTCQIKVRDAAGENTRILSSEYEVPIDCIFVLGGDGTFIRAARDLDNYSIPLIGVNLGNLGFLCELQAETVFNGIDAIFADHFDLEERMMLTGRILREEKEYPPHPALNDIVISRYGDLSIVALRVIVNGQLLYQYSCDGLIVATPTGSTAYSMSAGGPIIDPKSSMIVITPINAQAMSAKSIVLDSNDQISIEVLDRNNAGAECVTVAFDGDTIARLKPGEKIDIRKAAESTRVLKLSQTSFLETLRMKMNEYR